MSAGVAGAGVVSAGVAARSLARVSIITPGDWVDLDLDPLTRRTSIRRAVRQSVDRSPSSRASGVRLIGLLERISARAAASGGFYCASLVLPGAGAPVVATALMQLCGDVTVLPVPSVDERSVGLAGVVAADPSWAGAEVSVVQLPHIGPAVRIAVVDAGLLLQYLVPLPAAPADVVLTFSCPGPPYVQVMTQLFDAMASSLVLHYE